MEYYLATKKNKLPSQHRCGRLTKHYFGDFACKKAGTKDDILYDFIYMTCEVAVRNARKQIGVPGGQRRRWGADREGALGTAAVTAMLCFGGHALVDCTRDTGVSLHREVIKNTD